MNRKRDNFDTEQVKLKYVLGEVVLFKERFVLNKKQKDPFGVEPAWVKKFTFVDQ